MDSVKPIINKAAQRAIITLDLELYFPKREELAIIDLKDFLFKGLILREADFREQVKNTSWNGYKDRYVVLFCSAEAVIPMWAYMILGSELSPFATDVACSLPEHAPEIFLYRNLAKLNMDEFKNQRVVVKGCGERQIPEAAFVQIAGQLSKVARSVMFGEACSSVPVFKKLLNNVA